MFVLGDLFILTMPIDINPSSLKSAQRVYERALLSRSAAEADKAIKNALDSGFHPLEIYDKVIIPTQVVLGERWHDGEISISEEHIATQIAIGQMNRLRDMIRPKPPLSKKVLIGTTSGDPHWIGAKVVADHFFHDGWSVDFLGTCPPADDLLDYIIKTSPDVVIFSVSLADEIASLGRLAKKISSLKSGPKIIAGGRAFNPAAADIDGVNVASDPRQAVRLARKLCKIPGSDAGLEQLLAGVGSNIQAQRKRLRISQKQLADASGLDRAYLSAIEGGKQNVTLGVLYKLATALDIALDDLIKIGAQTP